jgi:hypothetical protein
VHVCILHIVVNICYVVAHNRLTQSDRYFRRVSTTLNPINFDDEHLRLESEEPHTHTHTLIEHRSHLRRTGAFFRLSNH